MENDSDKGKAEGVLVFLSNGNGFLRDLDRPFSRSPENTWVASWIIKKFGIMEGSFIKGEFDTNPRGRALTSISTICGLKPEDFSSRKQFKKLTAIDPCEKFELGKCELDSMRILDLIAPIGKGTRGLIVSPPKAGKTTLLEQLAISIHDLNPEVKVMVLLIDERPEEVTHFRRTVEAQILASSSDQSIEEHMAITEFTLSMIRTELECGHDVVLLVDSLTRMGRVFNQGQSGNQKILSGGVAERALEIPRRFFGLARNIEDGGSVTIIATVLIDTGSRMDQLIFEEFKGTGNSEIVLSRELADERIYPAIDITSSGTRKERLLVNPEDLEQFTALQKKFADLDSKTAITMLSQLVRNYPTNSELLKNL